MDERQFLRVLDLFPRVRSASYCEEDNDAEGSKQGKTFEAEICTSNHLEDGRVRQPEDSRPVNEKQNSHRREDVFWPRLRASVEKKLNPEDAAKFCDAFRRTHDSLVHAALTSETIDKALKT